MTELRYYQDPFSSVLDRLHDAHVRAYHMARFAAGLAGFIRSVDDARRQFASALAAAMRADKQADTATGENRAVAHRSDGEVAMSHMAWNYDMTAVPKDNSLLQLLIRHDDGDDCGGGFDDAEVTRTMGFNNFVNDGVDEWKFPGWDWCGDCITEQGCGTPIAWARMLPLPEPPAT